MVNKRRAFSLLSRLISFLKGINSPVEGTSWPSRLSPGELDQVCTAGGPAHLRCCLGSCSEELKMDLGLVLDASGRIGASDEKKQVPFVENLLDRVNLALNKAHVAMIKFSTHFDPCTCLNKDDDLADNIGALTWTDRAFKCE